MLLFAFDFDWTLVDEDSDRWVFGKLSPPSLQKLYDEHKTKQWTDLMDELHGDLYNLSTPSLALMNAWRNIPFDPSTAAALRLAASTGAKLIIISDANTIAIRAILKHHGLEDLFAAVISNPARFDEEGRLRISRLIPGSQPAHNCPNGCAVNICKGKSLNEYIAEHGPFTQIVYAGDGKNDLCPATKLRKADVVLPRTGHALAKLLSGPTDPAGTGAEDGDDEADPVRRVPVEATNRVAAHIREWATGEDLFRVISDLCAESTSA